MTPDLVTTLRRPAPAVGNWLSFPEPAIAELYAEMDFDLVVIDTEHTTLSLACVQDALRAIDAADGDTYAIVRVPGHDPDRIKRVLDLGADGIMVPSVDTVADAESIVDACRYPPDGSRGVGPGRGSDYGLDLGTVVEDDDEGFAIVVQIESVNGVEDAREIAAVDGVDALFVGPTDLSTSLGAFGEWDERFLECVDAVLDAGEAAETPVGTIVSGDEQRERWGSAEFDFAIVGYDANYVIEGSRRARTAYESIAPH